MTTVTKASTRLGQLIKTWAEMPRDKINALLLIFSCTLVLLPFAKHSPSWLNTIAALLILWRIWLTQSGHATPKKWLLTTIAIIIAAGVFLHFRTWFSKESGISLLVALACLKMLEMNMRRDALVVVFLCYFLLVAQLLYSQSLLAALYLLICIGFLISTQIAFQYHQLTPSLPKRFFNGFKIVGLAIPMALILFLLFPRFQGPLWGKPQGNPGGITGLSDTMEPGNVADLALSDQIAFRVRFPGKIPPPPLLYWRAVVLDTFNGSRWSASAPSTMLNAIPDQEQSSPTRNMAVEQEIIMEPHNQRWLFGLDRPMRLLASSVLTNGVSSITGNLTRYGEMRSPYPIQDRIRYTIISNLNTTLNRVKANTPAPSFSERMEAESKSLQLPAGFNPQTLEWANQLRQQTRDPTQLVNQVLSYFREKPFRYTMSPPKLGVDQIDDFMFKTQAGFCEHYSSAFVIIMRAMNIPARVVTGYQGGDINPIDGLMTIRQADAHAWAEVWLEPRGWVRVDPTGAVSPSRIERGVNASFPELRFSGLIGFSQQTWLSDLAKSLRLRWEATNSAWNLWALNYNLNKQKELLSKITGITHPDATQIGIAMMVSLTLVVAIIALFLFRKKTVSSPLDKLYDVFCAHFGAQGYPRMVYEGASDYGRRLQLVFPDAPALTEFLTLYSDYKYGKKSRSPLDRNQLHHLKTKLKLCLLLEL